jgi:hypothetical protein
LTAKQVILCAAALVLASAVSATPIVETVPGSISISAYAHSVHQGAQSHSQIYEADFGITQTLGVTAEVARICENEGRTDIGSVYFRRPVLTASPRKPRLAGYGGVTWLAVKDRFGERSEKSGPMIGATADFPIRPDLTFYGRSGVAFLRKPLWTLDFGIRYEVRPRWFLSLGYRSYDVEGSSLGGFLVGATYRAAR